MFVIGEMGIGNMIFVVVIVCVLFGGEVLDWIGCGIGVDDEGLICKINVVLVGLVLYGDCDLLEVLCCLGGCEIVVMVGVIVVVCYYLIFVIIDGFICLVVVVVFE